MFDDAMTVAAGLGSGDRQIRYTVLNRYNDCNRLITHHRRRQSHRNSQPCVVGTAHTAEIFASNGGEIANDGLMRIAKTARLQGKPGFVQISRSRHAVCKEACG